MRTYCITAGLALSLVSNVLNAQQARYWVELTDLNDAPITVIERNAEFVLSVYTQDLRDNPTGVFSAYLDVTYDAELALPIGPINHGDIYSLGGTSGSIAELGLLDEVGGVDGIIPLDGEPYKVFSLRFAARQKSGTLTFEPRPATDQLFHITTLYGASTALDPAEISFEAASLQIVPEPNSVFLFALGLVSLAGLRRQRKQR